MKLFKGKIGHISYKSRRKSGKLYPGSQEAKKKKCPDLCESGYFVYESNRMQWLSVFGTYKKDVASLKAELAGQSRASSSQHLNNKSKNGPFKTENNALWNNSKNNLRKVKKITVFFPKE